MYQIHGATNAKTYFKELRLRLKEKGFFEKQLATSAGMTPAQLSRSMRGNTEPLLSTVARLEGALDKLLLGKRGV
jgi:transcriptional regulator with XRE-family HTH domain